MCSLIKRYIFLIGQHMCLKYQELYTLNTRSYHKIVNVLRKAHTLLEFAQPLLHRICNMYMKPKKNTKQNNRCE